MSDLTNIFAPPESAPAGLHEGLPVVARRMRVWVLTAMMGNMALAPLYGAPLLGLYDQPLAILLALGGAALHLLMAVEMWTLQRALHEVAGGREASLRAACAALARFWTVAALATIVLVMFFVVVVVVAASWPG